MIFFPYRAQIKLTKIPIFTIGISVICLAVYIQQYTNERAIQEHAYAFCTPKVAEEIERISRTYITDGQTYPCETMVVHTYTDARPDERLDELTRTIIKNNGQPWVDVFRDHYRAFEGSAPQYLSAQLWHERPSWHVGRMLSSTIAHGSWEHVIFNLFFFFAFAATVELIIGPILFLAVSAALAIGIGTIDTLTHLGWPYVTVTVGLSGVVAGMLGLFAYFLPWAKIRFFYWILISAGTVAIPAWLVAAWYIGWDMHRQLNQVGGTTNFVAHLAGAALGFTIGLILFRKKRHWVRELVAEDVDLTQAEPFHRKVAFIVGIPGLIAVFFLFFTTGIDLLIWIAKSFWVQLLLAAPIVAVAWQLYRTRDGHDPQTKRYQKGLTLFELGEDKAAVDCLKPLAEKRHAGAQFALARIYEKRWGAMNNDIEAIRWYQAAADQGHAEAQYALGMRYAEGRGVPIDQGKALQWYRKAAERGYADAAFSLASRYERGQHMEADNDAAAEWYYRAGQLFLKAHRLEDVEMAVVALNGLTPDHPLGIKLRSLIEAQRRTVVTPSTTS
jgi:membrane associated rhomboid family serine protease